MKELVDFLSAHWPEIAAGFAAVIALITTIVNVSKGIKLSEALKVAQSRGTQVLCPKCKKTSPISEVHFILPDGSLDDNLDGQPDHLQ